MIFLSKLAMHVGMKRKAEIEKTCFNCLTWYELNHVSKFITKFIEVLPLFNGSFRYILECQKVYCQGSFFLLIAVD